MSKDPIGLMGGMNVHAYAPNPTEWIDPLGLDGEPWCSICHKAANKAKELNKRAIEFRERQLDKLPFNPTKATSALLNSANAGRLYATGMIKMGAGVVTDATGVGAAPGTASIAWGAWNLKSATAAQKRGQQQWNESLHEKGKNRCARNLMGVLPFGTEYDDPNEPSAVDVFKKKARDFRDKPVHVLEELGTFGL